MSRQAAARVGIDYEKIRQERRQKSKTQKEDGILKIQGVLLTWIAEDVGLFPKISRWLQPDDFFEEPYHTIAGMLYEQARTGEISPAQIISYFESKEEQSLAAGIFNKQVQQVNEDSEREKALNEMVKTLKKASLDKKSQGDHRSFATAEDHYGKEAVRDITHYIDINGKKLVNLQEWRKI